LSIHEPTPQEEIDAWLAKGNEITVCEPNARTEDLLINLWQRKRGRPKAPKAKPEPKGKK